MKQVTLFTVVTMTFVAAATTWAGKTPPSRQDEVRVCLSPGANTQVFWAEKSASQIFGRIGVRLAWSWDPRSCAQPNWGITIVLSERAGLSMDPKALAYAFPFGQSRIMVFYDRVKALGVRRLLAYVLVHEITHILQGTNDHAKEGIMKSHWDENDYANMRRGRLTFTGRDVLMIQNGLKMQSGAPRPSTTDDDEDRLANRAARPKRY